LNGKHGSPLKDAGQLDTLCRLVGGQPYLVRQALYALSAGRLPLEKLDQTAVDADGPFADHLKHHLLALQGRPELARALRQILHGGACDQEEHYQRLHAAGLISGDDRRHVRMRCQIYQHYFMEHL